MHSITVVSDGEMLSFFYDELVNMPVIKYKHDFIIDSTNITNLLKKQLNNDLSHLTGLVHFATAFTEAHCIYHRKKNWIHYTVIVKLYYDIPSLL